MILNLISESHPKFSNLLNDLLEKAEVLPIYATRHKKYYEIVHKKQIIKDFSFLIADNEQALGAFLGCEYENQLEKNYLSYGGMPCMFIVLPSIKLDLNSIISNRIMYQLNENKFLSKYATLDFEILFPFHTVNTITSIEKLIKGAKKHQVNYERAINLLEEEPIIFASFSKSTKNAIKKIKNEEAEIFIFDSNSTNSEQIYAMSILKKMHFDSAGRKTRSDESWDEQANQLRKGSILVTHGSIDKEIVHSSLFLLNGKSAYYGVSANKIGSGKSSVSHYFLYRTIIELKKRGFAVLFMGRQHESLERTLSNKEEGIEQFKSFFGGNLKPFLGFSSNV